MYSPTDHKIKRARYMWLSLSAACILAVIAVGILPGIGGTSSSPPSDSPDSMRKILPAGPRPVKNWPVILDNAIRYTPGVADIDGDGRDEIAIGVRDCRVHLLDWKGRTLPGWPRETAAWTARGTLLDDVDGDGEYEIVVGSFDGLLHMWHEDGAIVDGWPVDLEGKPVSTPVSVHSGSSPQVSILVSTLTGGVHLLSPDGTEREGWPVTVPHQMKDSRLDGRPTWTADLDGDGSPEILHLTSYPSVLYAWRLDGTEVEGFPLEFGGGPSLGFALDDRVNPRYIAGTTKAELRIRDLTSGEEISLSHDPSKEGFATGPYFLSSGKGAGTSADCVMTSSHDGYVYLWDLEGRQMPGWPLRLDGFIYGLKEHQEKHTVYGPPLTFDVDGDGDLEMILGSYDHHLYCFEFDGMPVTGWPVVLDDFIINSMAFAQLDGKGPKELVVGQFGESMFAFHLDPYSQEEEAGPGIKRRYMGWPAEYNAVTVAVLAMLLLLMHLLRNELSGGGESAGRRLRGVFIFFLLVLFIRAVFFDGDLFRYGSAMSLLERS